MHKRLLCFFLLLGLWLIQPLSLLAHPHVFVVCRLEMLFQGNDLDRIRVDWTFDEFFTAMILEDFDLDGNRQFSSKEIADIQQEAFQHLSESGYFTFVTIDGKKQTIAKVENFAARMRENALVYQFDIPCEIPGDRPRDIRVATFDPSYYAAVFFAEDRSPVSIKGANTTPRVMVRENEKETYYFGMMHPLEAIVQFGKGAK